MPPSPSPTSARASRLFCSPNREELTREQLMRHAREKGIAEICLPKQVLFMESIPRLGSGKIDYMSLANLWKCQRKVDLRGAFTSPDLKRFAIAAFAAAVTLIAAGIALSARAGGGAVPVPFLGDGFAARLHIVHISDALFMAIDAWIPCHAVWLIDALFCRIDDARPALMKTATLCSTSSVAPFMQRRRFYP